MRKWVRMQLSSESLQSPSCPLSFICRKCRELVLDARPNQKCAFWDFILFFPTNVIFILDLQFEHISPQFWDHEKHVQKGHNILSKWAMEIQYVQSLIMSFSNCSAHWFRDLLYIYIYICSPNAFVLSAFRAHNCVNVACVLEDMLT